MLDELDLRSLFVNELGWDHGGEDTTIAVAENRTFALEAIAHKRGFVAYQCVSGRTRLPDYRTRQQIERRLAKTTHEHLIVFATTTHSVQCWQWVKRELGQPPRYRQHHYSRGQRAEALTQKLEGLRFTLEEEERVSIADATLRVAKAFDVEKVTKRFYDRFKTEHQAFLGFIKGIRDVASREWYASLMLNRMMFIYFIQKRSFLDNDTDYLRNRLAAVAKTKGSGKFHSFYRQFLRRLFHEGLGQPEADRDPALTALLGRIPYLNGGLFDVHDLERDHQNIDIPDKAFKQIFDFFDHYQWHLDDRPLRDDNEINPDVLGYIFEKYVNQKQMGAYYTKEDITGYISRNTIVPRLFDQARKDCAIAFKPGQGVWRLLAEDPDRYFYPSVRHGITLDMHAEGNGQLPERRPLPNEIEAGLDDVAQRSEWNKAAPPEYALPTETWREHIARRRHYEEVRDKLAAGEVASINDLVTYNLDIEAFARDAIRHSEGPELVRAFWKAIRNISILDPTVGSGAFLFAALNVLEPLYNACLDAMRGLLDDLEHSPRKHRPEKMSDFRKALKEVEQHPSERYFVLKSIVINNLYGVDIMEEAVEICKLRLFLKLVAQLETYGQIEPLPDIDFNVRPGNTLVGFSSMSEVEKTLAGDLIRKQSLPAISEGAEVAARAFAQFQAMQRGTSLDAIEFSAAKTTLRQRLDDLRTTLDGYLAADYGTRTSRTSEYRKWRASHQPFHWFVEFYGIIRHGGFDVIIGNPPYVEYRNVKQYSIKEYQTAPCGNLYAFVAERATLLSSAGGRTGMIVPHSATCTDRMEAFVSMLLSYGGATWTSSYDIRPAKLFVGVDQRLLIYLTSWRRKGQAGVLLSSRYHRWAERARPTLLEQLVFTPAETSVANSISKIGSPVEASILHKLQRRPPLERALGEEGRPGTSTIYYHNAPRYWIRATDFEPYFWNERDGRKMSTQVKTVPVLVADLGVIVAVLNSSLFYWWFLIWSDCRHLNRREVDQFPFDPVALSGATRRTLQSLSKRLMASFQKHSERKETTYSTTGRVVYDEFRQRPTKPIVDRVDRALAPHYDLTEEEQDFLVNYDIKYRMGMEY